MTAGEQSLARRIARVQAELAELEQNGTHDEHEQAGQDSRGRIAALEAELADIELRREQEIGREVAELEAARESQRESVARLEREVEAARLAREQADGRAEELRTALTAAERSAQDARRQAAGVGAELAAANQFLRSHTRFGADQPGAARALSDELSVRDGYELALAAALGGRLDAALVSDFAGAEQLLDGAGPDGGAALLADTAAAPPAAGPAPGAGERLLDLLSGPPAVMQLATRLLADAWVVERLEDLPRGFAGIAVTRRGRVWFASWGEVRQVSEGGSERVLARRNERDRLIAASEQAAQAEHEARGDVDRALELVREGEAARSAADGALRDVERAHAEARELERRSGWLIEQRRAAPAEGPLAVRRAELQGELAAEARQAERAEAERAQRAARAARLQAQLQADRQTEPRAGRLARALAAAAESRSLPPRSRSSRSSPPTARPESGWRVSCATARSRRRASRHPAGMR